MKNYLLVLSAIVGVACATPAFAGTQAASVTAASDYNWRGLSFTDNGGAAVQGDLSLTSDYGLTVGAWAGNITGFAGVFGGYEFDPYLTYTHNFGDISVYGTFMWYSFAKAAHLNAEEYTLGMKWKDLNLSVSHIPEFFGYKTAYMYIQASYAYNFMDNLWAVANVGNTDFEKGDVFINGDYANAKVGVQVRKDKMVMEMAYSTTFGRENETVTPATKYKDSATIVSLTLNM